VEGKVIGRVIRRVEDYREDDTGREIQRGIEMGRG
jgi:hypothetical protein